MVKYLCIGCKKDMSNIISDDWKNVWEECVDCHEKMCDICLKKQRIDDVKTMLEKMLTDYYIIDEEAAMKHYNTLVSKGYYNESDENRKLYFK